MLISNSNSYFLPEDLVSVLLNKEYHQELSQSERIYDYSYLCFQDSLPLNTFGFSKLGISRLISEVNNLKFQSNEMLHLFDVNLDYGKYADKSECLPIIPYVDTSKASDDELSSLSKKIIEFIDRLDKIKLQGVLIAFFREYNDGDRITNYSVHVSPILLVPKKGSFMVIIFDQTGFELMGRQGQYNVVQIPTLRKSNSNCFSYSFAVLKKCISHPEMVQDILDKRIDESGQLEQIPLEKLPPELMQYLESVSTKAKYIKQTGEACSPKILNSVIIRSLITTLSHNGSVLKEEKTISCNLYNKTYKYAIKLLSYYESPLLPYVQEESKKFQKQQRLLREVF